MNYIKINSIYFLKVWEIGAEFQEVEIKKDTLIAKKISMKPAQQCFCRIEIFINSSFVFIYCYILHNFSH